MSQQELVDSIRQLERDMRAADRDHLGLIPFNDFSMVLLRNGGSVEQTEALIEQFGVEGRQAVNYLELLDNMKELAEKSVTPPLAKSEESSSVGPRSPSSLSRENAVRRRGESTLVGQTCDRWNSRVAGLATLATNSSAKDCLRGDGSDSGREKQSGAFYNLQGNIHATKKNVLKPRSSSASYDDIILPSEQNGAKNSRQNHNTLLNTNKEVKLSDSIERPMGEGSFSHGTRRTSSVERMLEQAKRCGFLGGVVSSRSGLLKGEETRVKLNGRSENNVGVTDAKKSETLYGIGHLKSLEASAETVKTARRATEMNESRLFAQGSVQFRNATLPHSKVVASHHNTCNSRVVGRGDLISLRDVFRLIDSDQDGVVALLEVWNAFRQRGIDIPLLELEALADSLELNVSCTSNNFDDGDNDDGGVDDRVLGVVEFCMLVSRMRSSFIERIRCSTLWLADAPASLHNTAASLIVHHNLKDSKGSLSGMQRHQDETKCLKHQDEQPVSVSLHQQEDLTPSPRLSLSPPSPATPPSARDVHPTRRQLLSCAEMNSFSPPPSVHTEANAKYTMESAFAPSLQGEGVTAIPAARKQHVSGYSVSVSPSPDMDKSGMLGPTPSQNKTPLQYSSFTGTAKKTEEGLSNGKQQEHLSVATSRTRSLHPYDLPVIQEPRQSTELTAPPPCSHAVTEHCEKEHTTSAGASTAESLMCSGDGNNASVPAINDYAAMHRDILWRQKQRIQEEDFLRKLEQEFQEKYGDLINGAVVEKANNGHHIVSDENLLENDDDEQQLLLASDDVGRRFEGGREESTVAVASCSSLSVESPPQSAENALARLLRPTVSSRAREQAKKFAYCLPRRTALSNRGCSSSARECGERAGGDIASISESARGRRSISSGRSEPNRTIRMGHAISSRQRQEQQQEQQQQQRHRRLLSFESSVSSNAPVSSVNKGSCVRRGSIRSVTPLSTLSKTDTFTLKDPYCLGSGKNKTIFSGLHSREGAEADVVRVSLVPSRNGLGHVSRKALNAARDINKQGGITAQNRQEPPPLPSGMPPRPPTPSNIMEEHVDDVKPFEKLHLSQKILKKLYGKCSQLLAICSNYDRAQKGFILSKHLGRALYAIAPDLTEGEISELVHAGIANNGGGDHCNYVSLVGSLLVHEGYVGVRCDDGLESGAPQNNKCENYSDNNGYASVPAPRHSAPTSSQSSQLFVKAASPRATPQHVSGGVANATLLEERVRRGRVKMNRLLREELLSACCGDYQRLRDVFFEQDDIHTGYLEEKVLRNCLVALFCATNRVVPPWVMDRCVRMCRTPFEREMISAGGNNNNNDNDGDDYDNVARGKSAKKIKVAAVTPPPESNEEEEARRRVHSIPRLLWNVLCDYRYMLEELRL